MIIKKHISPDNKLILVICDKELIGQKFEQDEKVIDTSADFYNGQEEDPKQIKELTKTAYSINAVGKKSVSLCIECGVVHKENIQRIQNIPYA